MAAQTECGAAKKQRATGSYGRMHGADALFLCSSALAAPLRAALPT
jgi:hypothetical protein